MLFLLIGVSLLGFAVFLVAELTTAPARQQELSIRRAAHYGRSRARVDAQQILRFRERVLTPGIHRLAAVTLRLNPKTNAEAIGSRLHASGLSKRFTVVQFLALKAGLGFSGAILIVIFGAATSPVAGFLLAPLAGVSGFILPDAMMTMRLRARREALRAQLPDTLDLLAVSVEAGLGLDGALAKLTEHMHGPLVDEFALTLGEIRIGESRHEALKKLTERVPTPEVAAFVRSVIQSDQLGISLGRILRVQAADSRLRRQAAAEEKAMKAPIKMLFPTVLLIFPAMFLVILGPAFLNLAHYLK
jgi:tight adherence protein C